MSDPTPEEIATLLDRYKLALPYSADGGKTFDQAWPLLKRIEIACMAATDDEDARRAETAERERDAAQAEIRLLNEESDMAEREHERLSGVLSDSTERATAAESRLADQAKVIEAARIMADALETLLSSDPDMPSHQRDYTGAEAALDATRTALSQLAEKGGDKT